MSEDDVLREYQRQLRTGERKVRYFAELSTPIYTDPSLWPAEGNPKVQHLVTRRSERLIDQVFTAKWSALFWLYGIKTEKGNEAWAWEQLARALAFQHVPGLSVTDQKPKQPRKRGAPKKWTQEHDLEFVQKINQLSDGKAGWLKRAIPKAMHCHPQLFKTSKGLMDHDGAVSRYHEAVRRMQSSKKLRLSLADLGPNDYKK